MITAQDVGLQLDGETILENVSFCIKKGEYVGLIGPNGAGKTSLIKMILGFYKETTGSLKIDSNIKVGYVPQRYSLSGVVPISVEEVLKMSALRNKKLLSQNLKKVGLGEDFLSRNFHKLSGGQQQRVIIARALCCNPDILIFDEPLTGVDYETKLSLYQLLLDLNKKDKLTMLVVSHEMDHILSDCHHILCLNKTMHRGCHPLDFAKGKITQLPGFENLSRTVLIHHHHNDKCQCPS